MEGGNQIIQYIIQGGAVGISVLLILYIAWRDKMYNKIIHNHLTDMGKIIDRNTEAHTKSAEAWRWAVKIFERVENKLDKHI